MVSESCEGNTQVICRMVGLSQIHHVRVRLQVFLC